MHAALSTIKQPVNVRGAGESSDRGKGFVLALDHLVSQLVLVPGICG